MIFGLGNLPVEICVASKCLLMGKKGKFQAVLIYSHWRYPTHIWNPFECDMGFGWHFWHAISNNSHKIPFNLSLIRKKEKSQTQWVRYGLVSELYLTLKLDRVEHEKICIGHCFECRMGFSSPISSPIFHSPKGSWKISETCAEITHLTWETVPYAFSDTISYVLCTFKHFHNFMFHRSARYP